MHHRAGSITSVAPSGDEVGFAESGSGQRFGKVIPARRWGFSVARFAVRIRPGQGGRVLNLALSGVVLVGLVSVAVFAPTADTTPQVRLSGGSAWLVSPTVAAVTLVDGPSEQIVASRRLDADPGDEITITQSGTDAYVVNHTQGTVAHIDGATQQLGPARQFADSPGALRLVAGSGALYALDANRGLASKVDPVTLQPQSELSLSARPGLSQSVVDGSGRLWVIDSDRGGLTWVDGDAKHTAGQAPGPNVRLVLVRDRPVLADLEAGKLSSLDDDGSVATSTCLDVRDGADAQLLGSASQDTVFAAISDTGTLVLSATDTDDCRTALTISNRGDILGTPVSSDRFLFVPNITTGSIVIVDTRTRQLLPPDLNLVDSGHHFELIAKDGLVFYNDLDGDRAGVLSYDGTSWNAGDALSKYDPGTGQPVQLDTPPASATGPTAAADGADTTAPPDNPAGQSTTTDRAQPPASSQPQSTPQQQPTRPADRTPQSFQPQQTFRPPQQVSPSQQPGGGTNTTSFAVTVTVSGDGRVTGPGGLNCPGSCSTTVGKQTPVALIAQPTKSGATVTWTGPCAGQPSTCSFTPDANLTITATITAPPTPALSVTVTGPGTVSATTPAGTFPCSPSCAPTVADGDPVTLVAAPDADATFVWSGVCADQGTTCAFNISGDTPITVTFTAIPMGTISVQWGSGSGGRVDVIHGGDPLKPCSSPGCGYSYRQGESVTLRASGDSEWEFARWSGAGCQDGDCSITIGADSVTVVTAIFLSPNVPSTFDLRSGANTLGFSLEGATGNESWSLTSTYPEVVGSPSNGTFDATSANIALNVTNPDNVPEGTTTNGLRIDIADTVTGRTLFSIGISLITNRSPVVSSPTCTGTSPNQTITVIASDSSGVTVNFGSGTIGMQHATGDTWQLSGLSIGSQVLLPSTSFVATDQFNARGLLTSDLFCP